MRLLDTRTLTFTKDMTIDSEWLQRHGGYSILSHAWGEDEVVFTNILEGTANTKLGYEKIRNACRQALRDGFNHIWIDTCCIDKRSSSELSEAINSMFKWYSESEVCYVYMADVS